MIDHVPRTRSVRTPLGGAPIDVSAQRAVRADQRVGELLRATAEFKDALTNTGPCAEHLGLDVNVVTAAERRHDVKTRNARVRCHKHVRPCKRIHAGNAACILHIHDGWVRIQFVVELGCKVTVIGDSTCKTARIDLVVLLRTVNGFHVLVVHTTISRVDPEDNQVRLLLFDVLDDPVIDQRADVDTHVPLHGDHIDHGRMAQLRVRGVRALALLARNRACKREWRWRLHWSCRRGGSRHRSYRRSGSFVLLGRCVWSRTWVRGRCVGLRVGSGGDSESCKQEDRLHGF